MARIAYLTIAIFAFFPQNTHARLGESTNEIVARYGTPQKLRPEHSSVYRAIYQLREAFYYGVSSPTKMQQDIMKEIQQTDWKWPGVEGMEFMTNNLEVIVLLLNGVSVFEEISRTYPYTENEILKILEANSSGNTWKEVSNDKLNHLRQWVLLPNKEDVPIAFAITNGDRTVQLYTSSIVRFCSDTADRLKMEADKMKAKEMENL